MEYLKISEIKINPANPRIIRDERYRKLVRSIAQFPKMLDVRGIVVDSTGMIVGGNQRYKALCDVLALSDNELAGLLTEHPESMARWQAIRDKKNSIPANWILHADDFTPDELRRFIIADNVEFGEHDWDMLANEWDAADLTEWGVQAPWAESAEAGQSEQGQEYTPKIERPIYEPKNEKPKIQDLFDASTLEALLAEIDASKIPDDEKTFLRLCANRHVVFNYEKIADYYAHSSSEVQSLMERSALVIIDFGAAIDNGYVRLSDEIAALYDTEYNQEEEKEDEA